MEKRRWIFEKLWLIIRYIIIAVAMVFLIRGFLLIPIEVEGNSMEGTLKQGDMILMEKITPIKRFDVVLFQLSDGNTYIKRVIGLPGDKIEYEKDQLYINGKKIEEPFLANEAKNSEEKMPYTTNFTLENLLGMRKLPEDSYFVMGDNRRVSKDSRSFGVVTSQDIFGKARFVYYPFNKIKVIS
ncbi:signal peptidase I [Enterococcus sp. JM4C]|uniref:signal peptidase I n=1 Tax=Candidatus Enterococcus huntleyi TaxID=1857217 RepID=UPI00137AF741|nr:signal peptidase I [Enterococcus sp. JM4C]KAF1298068.1 signal peptidase I [Enterococcus sp. JM4C]